MGRSGQNGSTAVSTAGDVPAAHWCHWIDGSAADPVGGGWIESYSPIDGRLVASLARGDADDIDAAARAAAAAQPAWAALSPAQRSERLLAIEAALRGEAARMAVLESRETGKPQALAQEEIEGSADYFGFYAAATRTLTGETFDLGARSHVFTRREPYGVVALITPWNYAVNQGARGAAPALAAGNAVVLKPSEFSSTTTLELARLASASGLPDGLLNVVVGRGAEVGEALVSHPLVRRVSFTGSVTTGRLVAHLAAERLIPATLELGGKSPHLVFADADLDRAATAITQGFLENSGQTCSAGTRVLVDAEVEDRLVERLLAATADWRADHELGPLITPAQYERVCEALDQAAAEGARSVLGGAPTTTREPSDGLFVEPTIYAGVRGEMAIAREEVFGPVLAVIGVDDEEEAVRLANDSPYGLVAGVWTRDLERALRLAARLEAGQVFVNGWGAPIEVPFGGMKDSGYGREKGRAALEEYSQPKSVSITLGD